MEFSSTHSATCACAQCQLHDIVKAGDQNRDDHGRFASEGGDSAANREANAVVHDKAAALHHAAANALYDSAATPTLHADSKFMRAEASRASEAAWAASSKTGVLYTKQSTPGAHDQQAGNHRAIAAKIRSGEIPSQ